jgi:hypothetical protein
VSRHGRRLQEILPDRTAQKADFPAISSDEEF